MKLNFSLLCRSQVSVDSFLSLLTNERFFIFSVLKLIEYSRTVT